MWSLKKHDGSPIKLNISGVYTNCMKYKWEYAYELAVNSQLMLERFFHPKNMTYDNCWQHNAVAPLEAVISEWWLTVFIQTNKQKRKCSVLWSALWMVNVN